LLFRSKIGRLWTKLTGEPSAFRLEFRIFHSISLIIILALAYDIPADLFIGLYITASFSLVSLFAFLYLYYRSRFKRKTESSIIFCAVIGNVLVIASYFYGSGIRGSTDILAFLTLLLIICITPGKQHKIWLSLSIAIMLALHGIEFLYPKLVPYIFRNRADFFFDRTSMCLIVFFLMYYTIKYIRSNYDSERRLAEEKSLAVANQHKHIIAQKEQLEQINTEKNKLLSIIAHDLRAPLSNIQNYLELVTEYGLEKDEREVVEVDLLNITRNTLNMLSKLLVWSKSQMEGVVVKLSDINLHEVLNNTLEMERVIALKKEITLTHHIDPAITVVADSDMLQLVVRNLVSNAIKFTEVGGTVDISTEMVPNECRLSVKDNGRGIAIDQQPDIFSLKARSTFGTSNEKGVGLGLLLCKEFTELQGGRIGFHSIPGEGSTFFIYIPVG